MDILIGVLKVVVGVALLVWVWRGGITKGFAHLESMALDAGRYRAIRAGACDIVKMPSSLMVTSDGCEVHERCYTRGEFDDAVDRSLKTPNVKCGA